MIGYSKISSLSTLDRGKPQGGRNLISDHLFLAVVQRAVTSDLRCRGPTFSCQLFLLPHVIKLFPSALSHTSQHTPFSSWPGAAQYIFLEAIIHISNKPSMVHFMLPDYFTLVSCLLCPVFVSYWLSADICSGPQIKEMAFQTLKKAHFKTRSICFLT